MISYHFDSKDGLFFTLARDFYSSLVDDLEALVVSTPDPVERLQLVLRRLAKLYASEQQAARMVMRELSVESSRVQELMPMVFDGHVRILVQTLKDAIDAGHFRPVPLIETLPSLLAPLIAPQILRIPVLLGLDAEKAADAALDVMLHGLLRRDVDPGDSSQG